MARFCKAIGGWDAFQKLDKWKAKEVVRPVYKVLWDFNKLDEIDGIE